MISDWLEKLGLSEYAQRFAENGIDQSRVPTQGRPVAKVGFVTAVVGIGCGVGYYK